MKYPLLLAFAAATTAALPSHAEEKRNWLFVMVGEDFSATDASLTVKDDDDTVFAFTDRPNRAHGDITAERFVSFWNEDGTFRQDPPNAVLTYSADGKEQEVELLLTAARMVENGVAFDVTVEAGKMPTGTGTYSLFIDAFRGDPRP